MKVLAGVVNAALAVLTFARTATFIPIYAAVIESNAPLKNEIIISADWKIIAKGIDKMKTKSKIVLYCRLRNVFAPFLMYLATLRISGVPGS